MPATIEPPAAPGASAPAKPSAAEQAAKVTINVSDLPKGDPASKPPKPGTAKAKLFDAMKKQFGGEPDRTPAKPADTTAVKPADAPPDDAGYKTTGTADGGDDSPALPSSEKPSAEAAAVTATPAGDGDKGKKVSPWKLVDQFKERATKAESRILELEKQVIPEEQRKASEIKYQELESKSKAMAEELRYYQSEKYDPDVIKAKEEYSRAFNRAMKELKEVSVVDPATQQPRALTVNDLAELAFMPLGQAQATAKEVFGDLAPYVMDHRNEIRKLWDAQEAVKEELKKNGSAREQQRAQEHEKQFQQLTEFVNKTYEEANKEVAADPKHGHFFKPIEGDKEWNARLEKGFKLVDEAFSVNSHDPRLTQEQRAEVIRKHAAVRNRAAAFGPLRHRVESLEKALKAAQEELKQFKETTPTTGGRAAEPVTEKKKGMAGLMDDLRKIAH
jgi:hypothetical protein